MMVRDPSTGSKNRTPLIRRFGFVLLLIFILGGVLAYSLGTPIKIEEVVVNQLLFDDSVAENEKQLISGVVESQASGINGDVTVYTDTSLSFEDLAGVLEIYVPVTSLSSARQEVSSAELADAAISVWHEVDPVVQSGISTVLGVDTEAVMVLTALGDLTEDDIAIIPIGMLTSDVKLLTFDGAYYLDTYNSGAIFRKVSFTGGAISTNEPLVLNEFAKEDSVLKVNQTGVTALTRVMMRKLNEVGDPLYFSKYIGEFLRDADITHISNEVSFKDNCGFSNTLFCSDPRFLETLKDSGVNLVELTGNHNNDTGRDTNTDTINLYRSLGWNTFGGGLDAADAAQFYIADQKGSKIAFLGYNYPDSPNGVAIATADSAGANSFDIERIRADIELSKQQADTVIVDVQYWECYSYPDEGYVEYPICDLPIGEQESVFKSIVDAGADIVVGSQAHQPQTFEIYEGKPIYYGLGNLYFDQTQWPGTERSIILTHYFYEGNLLQTKLTPTVYGSELQTRVMENKDAEQFLKRLLDSQ